MLSEKIPAAAATPVGADLEAATGAAAGQKQDKQETKGDEMNRGPLPPSERFTGHQLFYVVALDGVGGMALSAGVNFAIAYGEFSSLFPSS